MSPASTYAILGLLALLATSALAATCADSCNNQGYCEVFPSTDSYCACQSGFSGVACADAIQGGCTFNEISANATSYGPVSVGVSFVGDYLHVNITSPLVTQREYTIVAIDDSEMDNENCTYPGKHWERSFDSCNDIFHGEMPWAEGTGCGWSRDDSNPVNTIYSAQMVIEHHDVFDPFGNRNTSVNVERVTQHVVPLTVSFQKNISVASDIVVQAPVRLLAAVSLQSVAASRATATIEITTNLIWPYKLGSFVINDDPNTATSYTPSFVSETCLNDRSSCTQLWRILIVNGPACTLNGHYDLQWTISCQQVSGTDATECAIQPGDLATASLDVLSENYCVAISTTLPLNGGISSFADVAHATPKTQFLVGQTLYWEAEVVSPNVTVTATTIRSVKLTSSGEPDVLLYSDNVMGADGDDADFSTTPTDPYHADFQFTLTDDFIALIADDDSRTYNTVVVIDVDYLNVVTSKRGTETVEFTSPLTKQPVAVSRGFQAGPAPAVEASGVVLGSSLALVAALFLSLFA